MAWHFTRLFWEPSANCMTSRPVSSFGAKKKLRYILPVLHARTLKVTLKCHKSAFVLLQSSAKTNKQPPPPNNKQTNNNNKPEPPVFLLRVLSIFSNLCYRVWCKDAFAHNRRAPLSPNHRMAVRASLKRLPVYTPAEAGKSETLQQSSVWGLSDEKKCF